MSKYKETTILERGFGYRKLHSITAMEEYKKLSTDEIRAMDYKARGNFFDSPIAAIGCNSYGTKLEMTRFSEKCQRQQLSVTPIQLFEYTNGYIPSMTQNPLHDSNLSVVKTQQIIANLETDSSKVLDVHKAVKKSSYEHYSVEGYQPTRKLFKLPNAALDQPIEKCEIPVPDKHHLSQSSLNETIQKSEEIQMEFQEPENKVNYGCSCSSSSTDVSKKYPTIEKRYFDSPVAAKGEIQRNLDRGRRLTVSFDSRKRSSSIQPACVKKKIKET